MIQSKKGTEVDDFRSLFPLSTSPCIRSGYIHHVFEKPGVMGRIFESQVVGYLAYRKSPVGYPFFGGIYHVELDVFLRRLAVSFLIRSPK